MISMTPTNTPKSMPMIALATEDEDLGIFSAATAEAIAREEATKMGKAVSLRDPVSDKLLKTVKPEVTKTYSTKSNCTRAARKFLGNDAAKAGIDFAVKEVKGGFDFELIAAEAAPVPAGWDKADTSTEAPPSAADNLDIPAYLRRPAPDAAQIDRMAAIAKLGAPDRELVLRKSVPKREPTKKVAKPAKPTKSGIARAKKANGTAGPSGMVAEILKAASRAKGASRAELNDLTKWKGAPWKWLFKNPKKNGYCDRHGYKFEVLEGKDGETRYKVEKK